jgi:protein phosphatase
VVAGGIGGPGRGELASRQACRAAVDAMQRGRDPERALAEAGRRVDDCGRAGAGSGPLGATLAILRLHADGYAVASIGDARVFTWHAGRLAHVRSDADKEDGRGRAPEVAASGAATPHWSTQALGITPPGELRPVLASGPLEPGTQYLLCTDGLVEELDLGHLATLLARTDLAAQECLDHVLLAALDAGGRDDLTALLVRVH